MQEIHVIQPPQLVLVEEPYESLQVVSRHRCDVFDQNSQKSVSIDEARIGGVLLRKRCNHVFLLVGIDFSVQFLIGGIPEINRFVRLSSEISNERINSDSALVIFELYEKCSDLHIADGVV